MKMEDCYVPVENGTDLNSIQANCKILVISPHPDDDVIGMGGVIALHTPQEKVVSIYVTDGSGSLRENSTEGIVTSRRREALESLKILKAFGAFFLNAKSSELVPQKQEYSKWEEILEQIFSSLRPEEVYVTAPFENHPTHLKTTHLVVRTMQRLPKEQRKKIRLLGYPVWGPLLGKRKNVIYVDITKVVEKKKKAVEAHCGEIGYKAYHEGVIARNFYQSVFQNPHTVNSSEYLEVFLDMSELIEENDRDWKTFAREQSLSYLDEIFTF